MIKVYAKKVEVFYYLFAFHISASREIASHASSIANLADIFANKGFI